MQLEKQITFTPSNSKEKQIEIRILTNPILPENQEVHPDPETK
jgi:hypothetical protein